METGHLVFGSENVGLHRLKLALFLPLQLAGFSLGAFSGGGLLRGGGRRCSQPSGPLLQIVVVVTDVVVKFSLPLEGEGGGADTVEEVAVVADHVNAALEGDEGFFEEAEGSQIEIVGRLVHDQ